MGFYHDIYGFRSLFFPQSFQFSGAWWGWFWHCFNWFKKPTWERRITSLMAWLIQNHGNTWNQFHHGQMRLSLAWWLTCSREARDDSQICFMDGQFTYKAARTETTVFSWATLGNHILLYNYIISDWWFGTCFIFPHCLGWWSNLTNSIIFQRGRSTTNQYYFFPNMYINIYQTFVYWTCI